MIINEEQWNKLTCRDVYSLIREYNQTAPESIRFYFATEEWRKDRLCQGNIITYLIHRNDFESNELACEKGWTLHPGSFLLPSEFTIINNKVVIKQEN